MAEPGSHLPPGEHASGSVPLQASLVVADPHVAVEARHDGVDVAHVRHAAVRGHLQRDGVGTQPASSHSVICTFPMVLPGGRWQGKLSSARCARCLQHGALQCSISTRTDRLGVVDSVAAVSMTVAAGAGRGRQRARGVLPQGRVMGRVVRVVLLHGRRDVLAQLVQQFACLACTVERNNYF